MYLQTMFRRCSLVVAVLALSGAFASQASAAVTLGPDLTTPPATGVVAVGCQAAYPSCSFVNLRSTNPGLTVAAPQAGIITSWSFRAGMNPDTVARSLTLKTFKQGTQDGLGGYAYAVPMTTGPTFEIPPGNTLPSDPPTVLPARTPIAAGERVGILADQPVSFAVYNPVGSVTSTVLFTGFPPYNGEDYGNPIDNTAIALQAKVEADADGDGYGDETQDCYPTDPGLHGCEQVSPPIINPPIAYIPDGKCTENCGGGVVFSTPPPNPPPGDGSKFYVALKCPAGVTSPCGGFLIVETASGGAKPRPAPLAAPPAPVTFKQLAKQAYVVAPGKSKTVALKLSKAGKKLLKKKGKLKVTVTIEANNGETMSTSRTLKAR